VFGMTAIIASPDNLSSYLWDTTLVLESDAGASLVTITLLRQLYPVATFHAGE